MAVKRILCVGATGKQGGALISALTRSPPSPPFDLVALTRNATSSRAQSLAQKPHVTVVQGDLDDCEAIFKASPEPFHGVFSVQVPLRPKVEEQQGKSLIDAAARHGVKHFVYASVERGGPKVSDHTPTEVKHFASKFNIENHLKQVSKDTGGQMQWSIIRSVAFMDNLTDDFLGRAFAAAWQLNGNSKMQLVSAADIGVLAANMFKNPNEYLGKSISFATDELTFAQANEVFRKVYGRDMPATFLFVASIIKTIAREQLGVMMDWIKSPGFGADPNEYTKKFPEMQNFEQWLRNSSNFAEVAAK
jgi:uncharacterized protein YbjT (DUF2867 family)